MYIRERHREREKQTDRQRQVHTKTVSSNLVFYTQSTTVVVSGRKRQRKTERQAETVYI